MDDSRTVALIGEEAVSKLKNAVVAVFGVGGVGSYAAESLARSGVGTILLVDDDVVKSSNINRQLVALESTIGTHKTRVMHNRIKDINPEIKVITYELFYDALTSEEIFANKIDYVVDAIDSIKSKVMLICECKNRNIKIVSSMGAGNKLYPEKFEVMDIYATNYDPIAKILRKQLRAYGIEDLKVVCSVEQPRKSSCADDQKCVPASIAFVPSVCGLILSGIVIRELAGIDE
ncbi:MAG: tRNA threonylcarbamoyladenosine dehydratase [Christensenellaceae bacterium]